MGVDTNGTYNGCYGLLQKNISDAILGPTPFPFHHNGLTQGMIIKAMAIQMLSTYNCSKAKSREDSVVTDVMDSVYSFSWRLWLLIFVTLSIFVLMITTHFRLHKRRIQSKLSYSIWTVVNHVLEHDAIDVINRNTEFISTLLCVFIFFIGMYYENLISTDLVTVKDPHVIKSYDDVVEMKTMRPIFWIDVDDYKFFERAYAASGEETGAGRLWKKVVQEVGRDDCLIPLGFDSTSLGFLQELLKIDRVTLLITEAWMDGFRGYFCRLSSKIEVCSHLAVDPFQSFTSSIGFAVREDVKFSTFWSTHFEWISRIISENGLMTKMIIDTITVGFVNMGMSQADTNSADCLSDAIVTHPPEFDALTPSNLVKLFIVFGCSIVAATIVLILERRYFRYQKAKRRKVWRRIFRKVMRQERRERVLQRLMEIYLKFHLEDADDDNA